MLRCLVAIISLGLLMAANPALGQLPAPAGAPNVSGTPASAPNGEPPAAPKFNKAFVGTPEFNTRVGLHAAGTAAVMKFADKAGTYILTVRHLLGPDGGFPEQITAEHVPGFVNSIKLETLFLPGSKFYAVTGLRIPDSPDPEGPLSKLTIFKIADSSQADAVTLATTRPRAGEPVWVVAHVAGGVPANTYIHLAYTLNENGRWIEAKFDNPHIVTNGASGAPVLNAAGQIIGVYNGHSDREGAKIGFIIPAAVIADTLAKVP